MIFNKARGFLVRVLSLAIVCAGFAQASFAGAIGTGYLVDSEARTGSMQRIEAYLARQDVARQLTSLGVDPASIEARLDGLTQAELSLLESHIEDSAAGGDALSVIGAVFVVLLILELVGVTDVFSRI